MKNNIKKMSEYLLNNSGEIKEDKFQYLYINNIELDVEQPRKEFDANLLEELAESIKLYGVLTPISVSYLAEDKYILRHGERRLKASIIAGLEKIPAIIDENYHDNKLLKQMIENIQRESLTIQEISDAINYLHYSENMKLTEIAAALGKSNAYVSNYYNFGQMDHDFKELLLSKTNDIFVISEINRLKKLIDKESNKEVQINLNQLLIDLIKNKDVLNRNNIKEIKDFLYNNHTDNIKQNNESENSLKEDYLNAKENNKSYDDYDYESEAETDSDTYNTGEISEYDNKLEILQNLSNFKNNTIIEVDNYKVYIIKDNNKKLLLSLEKDFFKDENKINLLVQQLKNIF